MQEFQFDIKEYKKKIASSNSRSVPLFVYVFFCVILLGVVYFLKPNTNKTNKFYFVEINNFLNYNAANELSIKMQEKGGAGYIYFDGKYHVLASFYPNESNAETVCKNLKTDYPTATVFCLDYKEKINLEYLSENQKNTTKTLIENCKNCVDEIYGNILSFDKCEIDKQQLILNFKSIEIRFNDCSNDFMQAFNADSKFNKAKTYLNEMELSIKNLTNENLKPYMLKYEQIKFTINFLNIISCF